MNGIAGQFPHSGELGRRVVPIEGGAASSKVHVRKHRGAEHEDRSGPAAAADSHDSVSMQFAKIDLEYKPQKAGGGLDAGVHFIYDIKANKVG